MLKQKPANKTNEYRVNNDSAKLSDDDESNGFLTQLLSVVCSEIKDSNEALQGKLTGIFKEYAINEATRMDSSAAKSGNPFVPEIVVSDFKNKHLDKHPGKRPRKI